MQKSKSTDRLHRLFLLFLIGGVVLMASQGCVYVPVPVRYRAENSRKVQNHAVKSIELGKTTRKDILSTLGEPDESFRNDKTFVYRWRKVHGIFILFIPPQGSGGEDIRNYELRIHFDDNGIVEENSLRKL